MLPNKEASRASTAASVIGRAQLCSGITGAQRARPPLRLRGIAPIQTGMLALDDGALARICIGASRIPRGQRRRWLRKIADELDGDRAKQRHAARQAHHRQRQRRGARVYRLELADRVMEDVISALVRYGRLSEADTLKRAAVERALVEIIADVGRRFVMFRDDIR